MLFRKLREINIAFTALCCQPEGITLEELAFFCAFNTNKVLYTFGNNRWEDVYSRLNACHAINELGLDTDPFAINKDYDYLLERSDDNSNLLEIETESQFIAKVVISGTGLTNINKLTLEMESDSHTVYRFNDLFRHIPILLREYVGSS